MFGFPNITATIFKLFFRGSFTPICIMMFGIPNITLGPSPNVWFSEHSPAPKISLSQEKGFWILNWGFHGLGGWGSRPRGPGGQVDGGYGVTRIYCISKSKSTTPPSPSSPLLLSLFSRDTVKRDSHYPMHHIDQVPAGGVVICGFLK